MYVIRNKQDKRIIFGFDYRYHPPRMRYINEGEEEYSTPKLISDSDVEFGVILKKIPKTCELVKAQLMIGGFLDVCNKTQKEE